MDSSMFEKIVDRAKSDREFAQALLLDPAKVLRDVGAPADNIDRIKEFNAQDIIRTIVFPGSLEDCGVTVNCGETCTHTASMPDAGEQLANQVTLAADCTVTVNCTSTCTHTASHSDEIAQAGNPVGNITAGIRGKLAGR